MQFKKSLCMPDYAAVGNLTDCLLMKKRTVAPQKTASISLRGKLLWVESSPKNVIKGGCTEDDVRLASGC